MERGSVIDAQIELKEFQQRDELYSILTRPTSLRAWHTTGKLLKLMADNFKPIHEPEIYKPLIDSYS